MIVNDPDPRDDDQDAAESQQQFLTDSDHMLFLLAACNACEVPAMNLLGESGLSGRKEGNGLAECKTIP